MEKFTFSTVEAWKLATSLQTLYFIKYLPRILIRFLIIYYSLRIDLFYKTLFISVCEIGTKTHGKY